MENMYFQLSEKQYKDLKEKEAFSSNLFIISIGVCLIMMFCSWICTGFLYLLAAALTISSLLFITVIWMSHQYLQQQLIKEEFFREYQTYYVNKESSKLLGKKIITRKLN